MRGVIIPLLLLTSLFNAGCHDWDDYLWDDDYWHDWDDWDDDSDSGDYSTYVTLWRCPVLDADVAHDFLVGFSGVTVTDELGVDVFAATPALYARIMSGPDADWESSGVEFSFYEYFFLGLSSGETLVLRLADQLPPMGGGELSARYYLISAQANVSQEEITDVFTSLDEPYTVRSYVNPVELWGDEIESGSVTIIADAPDGNGTLQYGADVALADGGILAVDFAVATLFDALSLTFRDAYGREDTSFAGSYADSDYAIYVNGVNTYRTDYTPTDDTEDFDAYCGPGPGMENPVVITGE